jgi:hypothetical protein
MSQGRISRLNPERPNRARSCYRVLYAGFALQPFKYQIYISFFKYNISFVKMLYISNQLIDIL